LVATLDRIFREEWGRVLAALIGFLGDLDLAEAQMLSREIREKDGLDIEPHAVGPSRGNPSLRTGPV
jgi:RNA polymerase sigma-70 factor (ECF subfamily)